MGTVGASQAIWRTASSFAKDILLGILIWFFLITAVGEARMIPSESMEPTILVGDRVWTDKLFLRFGQIERGDILVFDPPIDSEVSFIKRVVGLPGEEVVIAHGKVWVDGEPLDEPYIAEAPRYHYGPVKIPDGMYLMLGDNRNESLDGHVWGLVARGQITARAAFRIWPAGRWGAID